MSTEFGPLVGAAVVEAMLASQDVVILDTRLPVDGGRDAFMAGHLPGAIHTDYGGDGWRARIGPVPGLLPSQDAVALLLGRLGITPVRPVVVVPAGTSANDLAAAARIFWTLSMAGHDHVAILDGGWARWSAEARPAETGWRDPHPAPAYPVIWRTSFRATSGEAAELFQNGSAVFVDARSASYFRGLEKSPESLSAGHIPGAYPRDYADLYDPTRHGLKARAELDTLFAAVPRSPIVSYCNTGHTAALNWFVLSQLLGRDDVRLYDGSMTDWTQDPERPVAINGD